jgi:hypothetical protein
MGCAESPAAKPATKITLRMKTVSVTLAPIIEYAKSPLISSGVAPALF